MLGPDHIQAHIDRLVAQQTSSPIGRTTVSTGPARPRTEPTKRNTDMKPKCAGLWAIGTGLLIGAGLLTAGRGYADERKEHMPACTLATLKGQYVFSGSGTLLAPAFGLTGTQTALIASAGYHIFNGDGTGMDFVTFTVNGINQNVPSPVPTTYTLGPDCTGTYTVQAGPRFNIFVAHVARSCPSSRPFPASRWQTAPTGGLGRLDTKVSEQRWFAALRRAGLKLELPRSRGRLRT